MQLRTAVSSASRVLSHVATVAALSEVPETVGQMTTDLRSLVRIAYVWMFAYTVVASLVLLYTAIFVYERGLEPAIHALTGISIYDVVPIEGELILFGIAALVPILNCGRLLFLARISGRDPLETFSLWSLFRVQGVELAVLVVLVPFLSKELFEATGLQTVTDSLTGLANVVLGEGSVEPTEMRRTAVALSVLYLYPSIVLVYLSHSKLTKLYPFTQFLTIARTWSYLLLIVSAVPILLVLNSFLGPVIGELSDPMVEDLWIELFDPEFGVAFVILTTVTFQFVFVRLGAITVSDERIRSIFRKEVDREVQLTLNDFSGGGRTHR